MRSIGCADIRRIGTRCRRGRRFHSVPEVGLLFGFKAEDGGGVERIAGLQNGGREVGVVR